MAERLRIEVVFATPERQVLIDIEVAPGTTAAEAVHSSGVLDGFDDIDAEVLALGVWGKRVDDDYVVAAGDRVEVYRPLQVDPMDARRQRAVRGPG